MADARAIIEPRWFVVTTKPNSEALAKEHLGRQDFRVCAPQLRLKKRRRGKWLTVVEPLFPGYVFVELMLGLQDTAPIRSTIGCRELVRFNAMPTPVPEIVMQPLLQLNEKPAEIKKEFKSGDKVRIESGPFGGIEAVFQMQKGEDRVQVLIHVLGAERPLVVDEEDISARGI